MRIGSDFRRISGHSDGKDVHESVNAFVALATVRLAARVFLIRKVALGAVVDEIWLAEVAVKVSVSAQLPVWMVDVVVEVLAEAVVFVLAAGIGAVAFRIEVRVVGFESVIGRVVVRSLVRVVFVAVVVVMFVVVGVVVAVTIVRLVDGERMAMSVVACARAVCPVLFWVAEVAFIVISATRLPEVAAAAEV